MEAEQFYIKFKYNTFSQIVSRKKIVENFIRNHPLFVISMLYSPDDFKADKMSVLRNTHIRHNCKSPSRSRRRATRPFERTKEKKSCSHACHACLSCTIRAGAGKCSFNSIRVFDPSRSGN